MNLPRIALALWALTLAVGCKVQQPSTPVPAAPRIVRFSATPATLDAPGPVTLTWETADATRINLDDAQSGDLGVGEDVLTGSTTVTVSRSSVFILSARGEGGTDLRALSVPVGSPAAEAPALFVLPAEVRGGESITLAWTAPGASTITLTGNGVNIDPRGQVTGGALQLHPQTDTTYTLTAGSKSVSAQVTVLPAVLSAEVSPPAALVGDTVQLRWSVAGAERLVVTRMGGGTLLDTTDAARIASGTLDDVVPSRPQSGLVTYELVVTRGTETIRRTVTLIVDEQLAVARLEVPATALANATFVVRWVNVGATRVELSVDGQTVFTSATPSVATQGAAIVSVPGQDFTVELTAISPRGERARREAQVEVLQPPPPPTLTASPGTVALGSPVTLTFSAPETRLVRIVDDQGFAIFSVLGAGAEAGTVTVYPSRASTTYTLSADNQLGSTPGTATATVTVTGGPLALTQWPPNAIVGQQAEFRAPQADQVLSGFPHDQVLFVPSSNFEDISQTGQLVLEGTTNVAAIDLPFKTLLFGEPRTGSLTISRAGWIAWGATLSVNTSEQTLPSTSTSAYAGIIAPYWENVTGVAGVSKTFAQLVGDAPDQRLVVQWQGYRENSNVDSELTFQVQVSQSGVVSFHYKTMQYDPADPPSGWTVGLQSQARDVGFMVSTEEPPVSDTSYYFFTPVSGAFAQRAANGRLTGGFLQLGDGWAPVTATMKAVRVPLDVAVTEAMPLPSASLPNGQYVEVTNGTGAPLDLTGWSFSAGSQRFPFPAGTTVPALTPLLVGASTNPLENEDAGVSVAWGTGFSLPLDGGDFTFGTDDAGQAYGLLFPSDGGAGVSVEFDPGPFLGANPPPTTCLSTLVSGSQLGSPGYVGGCTFRYVREPVTPNFRDISMTGTALTTGPVGDNDSQAPSVATLATTAGDPAPFLFRTRAPVLRVSPNGWLTPRSITTTGTTNKTTPTTGEPLGVIAPFWDDLHVRSNSTMHWQRLEAAEDPLVGRRHWIIQWSHFSTDTAGASTPDDLNFQVKLFENGDIEFHYGTLSSGTTGNLSSGSSATVWIDNGSLQALPISVNTATLQSNAAYRFAAR